MKQAAVLDATRWLVGSLLAASLIACSGSNPGASGPGAAPGGGAGTGPDGRPVAVPGQETNPGSLPNAAPPPANAGANSQVRFNDATNFPFVDPTTETSRQSQRFFEGSWTFNNGYMQQSHGATTASLSFRQYTGNAFGTANGVAPGRYRADVTVWAYQPSIYSEMVGKPLGILGYAPYFIDETHYLLAVAKPTNIPDKPTQLEVWAVDGQVPGTEWPASQRVWAQEVATPLQVGSPVAWSVQIDTAANSATIWANGEEKATITHPLLANRGQRVALISNGNFVHFQDFKLFAL